jgi:hypothetical protein
MTTEVKQVTLKTHQDKLALQIEGLLTHDSENRIKTDGIFEQTLPEGLSMEIGEKWDAHRAQFIPAARVATGRYAHKLKTADDKITSITADFEMGKFADVQILIEKSSVVPDRRRNAETGAPEIVGEKTVHGRSTVNFRVKGAENSKGDMKVAGEFISQLYTGSFGSN